MRTLNAALCAMLLIGTSGSAATFTYSAFLDALSENPPNPSLGTGNATVIYDSTARTLRLIADFQDLTGTVTIAHIHCCILPPGNTGVATTTPTLPGFPSGVTFGSYDHTLDLTDAGSFNPAFVTAQGSLAAAEAALTQGIDNGQAYLNIHTTFRGGGEIRGFLQPVPEPATGLGVAGVLAGILFLRMRKQI